MRVGWVGEIGWMERFEKSVESVIKAVLAGHYRLPEDALSRVVFPQSAAVRALEGILV